MPPTSSPWLKALEAFGSIGYARSAPVRLERIGDPSQEYDAARSLEWRDRLTAPALFAAWSPPPRSPWAPYAKPTLFAALDAYRGPLPGQRAPSPEPGLLELATAAYASDRRPGIGPRAPPGIGGRRPPAVRLPEDTAIIVDLPGPATVAYGAWLARLGYQPVPLWNNWPHPRGLVDMDGVLAALLHYVPWVAGALHATDPRPRPAFLLDRDRLGRRNPFPLEFDNRYFHVDVDFPSAATLRRNGIRQLLYVAPADVVDGRAPGAAGDPSPAPHAPPRAAGAPVGLQGGTVRGAPQGGPGDAALPPAPPQPPPAPPLQGPGHAGAAGLQEPGDDQRPVWAPKAPEPDDLNRPLTQLGKALPLLLAGAALNDFALGEARPWGPAPRKTPFNTVRDPSFLGYRRAAAGGFGRLVPDPSSGGG